MPFSKSVMGRGVGYLKPKPQPVKQTFAEWFEEYNKQHGLPPAYIVAGHAWAAGQRNK